MRIIGGKAKGHRLISPKGKDVRPTADRVKEAIFSSLQLQVPDALVLDLFAGAGSLGIEALSRYAQKVYFVDQSPSQIRLIRANLDKTHLSASATLICQDVNVAIRQLAEQGIAFQVVFMDPPYGKGLIARTLDQLDQFNIVMPEGVVVAEFSLDEDLPEQTETFLRTSVKRYGSTGVAFYRRREVLE